MYSTLWLLWKRSFQIPCSSPRSGCGHLAHGEPAVGERPSRRFASPGRAKEGRRLRRGLLMYSTLWLLWKRSFQIPCSSPRSRRGHVAHGEPAVGQRPSRRFASPGRGGIGDFRRQKFIDCAKAPPNRAGCRPWRGCCSNIFNAAFVPRLHRGLHDRARFSGLEHVVRAPMLIRPSLSH